MAAACCSGAAAGFTRVAILCLLLLAAALARGAALVPAARVATTAAIDADGHHGAGPPSHRESARGEASVPSSGPGAPPRGPGLGAQAGEDPPQDPARSPPAPRAGRGDRGGGAVDDVRGAGEAGEAVRQDDNSVGNNKAGGDDENRSRGRDAVPAMPAGPVRPAALVAVSECSIRALPEFAACGTPGRRDAGAERWRR